MRIDLVAPYADKDAVKALGARWDGAKKVWYIVNVTDLTPFARWLPIDRSNQGKSDAPPQHAAPHAKKEAAGTITRAARPHPVCACAVLPWEDCAHSLATA